jgi:ATP-dependent helicase/nuclease subunit A
LDGKGRGLIMADISFSEDQKKAIYANERNILVSAAAGSGKTAVLVKRIIEKIKDEKNGTDIDRFVVVTFTKAAAREMKERIGKAINEELAKDPENENLQKQSTLINRATITTMDSFCNSVVKKYFHLTTLDPDFRIADSTDVESLRDEAMNEVLEERYEKASEAFMKVDSLFIIDRKNNDDQMLVETIWKLYNFSQSMPHPDKWLDECAENFNLQDKTIWDSVWGESFKNIIKDKLEYFKHNADKFADYYDLTGYDIPTAEDVIKDYDERYQNYCSAL